MEKLREVETAKELMTEATSWSVMKWLREKKSVRKAADQANAGLDQLNAAVKQRWPEGLRAAYDELSLKTGARRSQKLPANDVETRLAAKKVKEMDDEAYRARMDAEDTFDKAEKQLSTSLAREGCRKAILSWELHEKAIVRAESFIAK